MPLKIRVMPWIQVHGCGVAGHRTCAWMSLARRVNVMSVELLNSKLGFIKIICRPCLILHVMLQPYLPQRQLISSGFTMRSPRPRMALTVWRASSIYIHICEDSCGALGGA